MGNNRHMSSFDEYLSRVKDAGFAKMALQTKREAKAAEETLQRQSRGKQQPEYGVAAFVSALKGMAFWLHSGMKPAGMDDEEFAKLKPICERFVSEGVFKSEALAVFGKTE